MTRRPLFWLSLACSVCCTSTFLAASPASAPMVRRQLSDALSERRIFRHVLVGKIQYPSERFTWVLLRGQNSARLEVYCQEGNAYPAKGITLDGRENNESYWLPPATTSYAGARTSGASFNYDLRLESAPTGNSPCATAPSRIKLECRPWATATLAARAVLMPGTKLSDDTMTHWRWMPPQQQAVAALRCEVVNVDATAQPLLNARTLPSPLMFAQETEASPGIEWVYENSDMVVQTGAYRFMSRTP